MNPGKGGKKGQTQTLTPFLLDICLRTSNPSVVVHNSQDEIRYFLRWSIMPCWGIRRSWRRP